MEKIQTGFRGILKSILFIINITQFLIVGFLISVTTSDKTERRRKFLKNTRQVIKQMLFFLNAKVVAKNLPPEDQNFLLVSNHMGFLDIFALSSISENLFITSQEMRETPGLGLLTELGGCIFVERRSRARTRNEMQTIAKHLLHGFRIVLYPEATSTNGEQVLPFKRTLMLSAIEAKVPIQPVVVNFKEINGDGFIMKWRDHVCWYGDQTFLEAFVRVITLKSVTIEVEFLPQVLSTAEMDKAELALKIQKMIADKFVPVRAN